MEAKTFYSPAELFGYLKDPKEAAELERFQSLKNGTLDYLGFKERANRGFPERGLMIPESIEFFISPPACGRHGDMHLLAQGKHGRYFRIRLSELDIVNGTGPEKAKRLILEFVESLKKKPKVVVIITTCVDVLLHTDYSDIERALASEFGIRTVYLQMAPILFDSPNDNTHELKESIYLGMKKPKGQKRCINVIGNNEPLGSHSEMRAVFQAFGYKVQSLLDCRTIEDYDDMALASLNLVVSPWGEKSACAMLKQYGIPYVLFPESISAHDVLENYKRVFRQLNIATSIDDFCLEAKELAHGVSIKHKDARLAIGPAFDLHPLKLAADLLELGFRVEYIFCKRVEQEDLPALQKLAKHSSNLQICLGNKSKYLELVASPINVDLAIGITASFTTLGASKVLNFNEEPFEFSSQIAFFKKIDKALSEKTATKAKQAEASPYARNWSAYKAGLL